MCYRLKGVASGCKMAFRGQVKHKVRFTHRNEQVISLIWGGGRKCSPITYSSLKSMVKYKEKKTNIMIRSRFYDAWFQDITHELQMSVVWIHGKFYKTLSMIKHLWHVDLRLLPIPNFMFLNCIGQM